MNILFSMAIAEKVWYHKLNAGYPYINGKGSKNEVTTGPLWSNIKQYDTKGEADMERIKKNFGFGFMRLPMQDGEVDIAETNRMVDAFLDAGFNYFDTAHG